METSNARRALRRAALAAALTVLPAATGSAQSEVAFAPNMSHVNQKLPELVTLSGQTTNEPCSPPSSLFRLGLHRTYPDGAVLPFTTAPGKFLVVTDVTVQVVSFLGEPAGREIPILLALINPNTNSLGAVFLTTATIPPSGPIVKHVRLGTGFTMGGASRLCLDIGEERFPQQVLLHGYLMRFP